MEAESVNLNILAVDDEPGIRALYSRALGRKVRILEPPSDCEPAIGEHRLACSENPNFKLHVASSGTEAVDLVARLYQEGIRFAAGFFDLRMPGGLDGIGAIRKIRALDPNVLCTVVTAYGEDRLQEINQIFSPDHLDEWDYLSKPFNVGEIMQKARNAVSSWNRRRDEEKHLEEIHRVLAEMETLNRTLDARVEERTEQLEIANTELESILDQLRQTQSQLVHNAKMSGIGRLAAGIAHEINNPVGVIQSNLATGERYLGRLSEYIAGLEDLISGKCDLQQEIATLRQQAKIDFILSDFPNVLADSSSGTTRVRQIVSDLKTFSQLDQGTGGTSDPNDMLRSAVNLISGELKPGLKVSTDFGELPDISMKPQELGQVFMNILLNAVQASSDPGEISVSSRHVGDRIKIEISDTGCGIEPQHLERIFDPFFTTKDVGAGMGLGLTVAYNIIKNHGGELYACSQLGVGTTFTASLPVT